VLDARSEVALFIMVSGKAKAIGKTGSAETNKSREGCARLRGISTNDSGLHQHKAYCRPPEPVFEPSLRSADSQP
jgi:hypothetical protein